MPSFSMRVYIICPAKSTRYWCLPPVFHLGPSRKDVSYYCPTGVDPGRDFMGPTFWGLLDTFHEETRVSDHRGSTLIAINAGLMKPRKGFTPVKDNKKLEVGKNIGNNNGWFVTFEFSYCFATISKILAARDMVFQLCLTPAGMK